MRARSAEYDLSTLIKQHVFVLCPNNSGSTLLSRALAECRNTWSLPREGQASFGYVGPKKELRRGKYFLLWACKPDVRAVVTDPASYDWDANKKAFYFQASSANPKAHVFIEKTPYHLMIVDQLVRVFANPYFLIMVRNPFATIEGIQRLRPIKGLSRAEMLTLAADHVGACFEAQVRNAKEQAHRSCVFTYEDLCQDPATANARIRDALPELDDIELDRQRAIKGTYDERLRNMNADQIARLSQEDLRIISKGLAPYEDALAAFGYGLNPAQP